MELVSAGDLSFSRSELSEATAPSNKRQRECDDVETRRTSRSPPGVKHASITQLQTSSSTDSSQPLNFVLPMYSNELGSLPVYGQFNFSDSHWKPDQAASFRDTRANLPNLRPPQASIFGDSSSGPLFSDTTSRSYFVSPDPPTPLRPPFQGEIPSHWDFQVQALGSVPGGVAAPAGPAVSYSEPSEAGMPVMDNDTLTMWSTAPTGLE